MSIVHRSQALMLLRKALANTSANFRPGQWEAIDNLVNHKKRLLVVERTGWGKSYVYFITTKILRDLGSGPTLLVSPLLALMRNQINAAGVIGIKALSISSDNPEDWPSIIGEVKENHIDTLLVSPERLANEKFVDELLIPVSQKIGLLVVDEAHCISDWGHAFRPDYRRLVNVLQKMPDNMPIVATTATANKRVINDVAAQLGDIIIQRGPLMRETLQLQIHKLPSQAVRLAWLATYIKHLPGTGIIYTLTKRDAEQVTEWLRQNNVDAYAYYGAIMSSDYDSSSQYRAALEQKLMANEIKVLVATTALGMGFDKPDLGFVIHYQAPSSIVSYYQQVGRAGRGIENAIGVLLSGKEDIEINEYFRASAFPKEKWVNATLRALENSDGKSIVELEDSINLRHGQIEKVLKYLSVENPAPIIKLGAKYFRTSVPYQLDHARINRLTNIQELEWAEIQNYIATDECLMTFLARALDDEEIKPCQKCANCLGRDIIGSSVKRETVARAASVLKQAEIPLKCKKKIPTNSLPIYGFRGNLSPNLHAETGRVLSRWLDAGWGELVAEGKKKGRFSDELIEPIKNLITERWSPEPKPAWVTCVPSLRNPSLVPEFTKNLAQSLGLPFNPIVFKIQENEPQKIQQNWVYQCRNLDGVFEITGSVPKEPVLLIDDIVDSCWTLTLVAALLRRNGSGCVFPVALATSSPGA